MIVNFTGQSYMVGQIWIDINTGLYNMDEILELTIKIQLHNLKTKH